MGTPLTGLVVGATYNGLLKTTDNAVVNAVLRVITDGLGNDTALSVSTAGVKSSGTFEVTGVATLTAQPILSALTASSAVATDASKGLVSVTNTGTGSNVLATSPTLVTPLLGTPTSGNLVNCTGYIAPAGTLTGTTLAANVVNTSITGTGILGSGSINWSGSIVTSAYGAFGTSGSSTIGIRVRAPSAASNQAITLIENAGVHQINIRPNYDNAGGGNLIQSDYLSGATYLPLKLSGRGVAADFVLGTDGNATFGGSITGGAGSFTTLSASSTLSSNTTIRLKGYTVAALPAGTQGDSAFVTDAAAPTFLVAVVGGGAIVTPVFYNGTSWVAG